MTTCKKPIRRHMLVLGIIFITIMIVLISIQSAGMLRIALFRRYDAHLRDVVNYVSGGLELSDIQEYLDTGRSTEKFNQLGRYFDRMAGEFELVHLYICVPTADESGDGLRYIVASSGAAERAAGRGLGEDKLAAYREAWDKSPEPSTFEGNSEFGPSYTMCKPLVTENGETIALLGADLSTKEMLGTLRTYQNYSIGIIVFIAVLFSVNVALWLRRSVTEPIAKLRASALSFAERSHGEKDPEKLVFEPPELYANNEVQWISDAIVEMSEGMRENVVNILAAEKQAETVEKEAEGMARLAYEDNLTEQMSKVAYDAKKEELRGQIADGSAEFALVVVNLNNLKRINETYGLECGNRYIVSGGRAISSIYRTVPVYRVGGDEFVVILEGGAYRDRFELFDLLEEQFQIAGKDTSREPWERCSAAAGMTEYSSEADKDVNQVYRRAEKIMLRNKRVMKNEAN